MMVDPVVVDRDWVHLAAEREHPVGVDRPYPCLRDAHGHVCQAPLVSFLETL